SRDITHKSDVGGVALDLGSEQMVRDAVAAMHDKVCTAAPGARIDGFVVQPMIKRPHAVELILGAAEDPVFGPILMVGHGGAAGEGRGARFAIKPYPVELEVEVQRGQERLRIRPIKPDDEALLQRFIPHLTPEDIRLRFFGPLRELTHEMAARLTQIDYDREM